MRSVIGLFMCKVNARLVCSVTPQGLGYILYTWLMRFPQSNTSPGPFGARAAVVDRLFGGAICPNCKFIDYHIVSSTVCLLGANQAWTTAMIHCEALMVTIWKIWETCGSKRESNTRLPLLLHSLLLVNGRYIDISCWSSGCESASSWECCYWT